MAKNINTLDWHNYSKQFQKGLKNGPKKDPKGDKKET